MPSPDDRERAFTSAELDLEGEVWNSNACFGPIARGELSFDRVRFLPGGFTYEPADLNEESVVCRERPAPNVSERVIDGPPPRHYPIVTGALAKQRDPSAFPGEEIRGGTYNRCI